jgi:hypothetical protein
VVAEHLRLRKHAALDQEDVEVRLEGDEATADGVGPRLRRRREQTRTKVLVEQDAVERGSEDAHQTTCVASVPSR